ncbi:MAG: HDOD domain-containing protein [Methylococcaceae bacterium]
MNAKLLANQVESLFSLPEVALRINEVLNSPEPSNTDLEELIITDPALTANILKIVNSAYFGFPGTIDTVSRAITLIGLKELRNLVFTTAVTTSFKGIPKELIDMDVFWYHSVTSGVIARILAKKIKHSDYERLFIGGLLHSIGKLIYFSQYPEVAREILDCKDQGEEAMISAEQSILGFTYAELGAEFLKHWQLPPSIWQMISYHLDPLNAKDFMSDACLLHVAGKIAGSIEPCAKYDFDFNELEPKFNLGVLAYLKVSPNLIEFCIDEALMQAFEILAVINPKATTMY